MSSSDTQTILAILNHDIPIDTPVTIEGWVRSRRTSKGGFSFIHVNDGSSLDNLQAVANADLANYEAEIAELNTGCAVRVSGQLVESSGKGQDREIQVEHVEVIGWVDDPESYPIAKKRHSFEYLRRRWQHCYLFGLAQTELHAQSQQGDYGHCDEKTTDGNADSHDPL